MKRKLQNAINLMVHNIINILQENVKSVYLYGSVVLGDFKFGWSDIDILVITKNRVSYEQAEKLLTLRQDLLSKYPKNKYFRCFEGAILSENGFLSQENDTVVYWGTKGEKIKESYSLSSFSLSEIHNHGVLLYGKDIRNLFKKPTYKDLILDVKNHYISIREHAKVTGKNLYSFGWFLDISRCLYTLKTGDIISKTLAGEWALKNELCPCVKPLKVTLRVRKRPNKLKKNKRIMEYASTLGDSVQKYADVLENEIKLKENGKE